MQSRASRRILAWVLGLGLLATMYGPAFIEHGRLARTKFNDDICQHVAPLMRPLGEDSRDYAERYCLSYLPTGYRALFSWTRGWLDPLTLTIALSRILFAVFVGAMALTGFRFAGGAGAWAAVALALSADVFLARTMGGLARSFAFPLLACAVAATVYGRPVLLSAVTCAAAFFYPAMAVSSGLALALITFLGLTEIPAGKKSWCFKTRIGVVAPTACVAALLVLPTALALSPYGPSIRPDQLTDYPEAGPGGRFSASDRVDFDLSIASCLRSFSPLALQNRGGHWMPGFHAWTQSGTPGRAFSIVLTALVALGAIWSVIVSRPARRLALLTAAAIMAYLVARRVSPLLFLPERQAFYPSVVLTLIWLIVAAAALPDMLGRLWKGGRRMLCTERARSVGVLAICGFLLLARGGRVLAGSGLTFEADKEDAFYSFIGALPETAYVAGWPNWMAPVPLLSGRPVLVSYEMHLPFQSGYTDEMRRRMRRLIAAYFAGSPEPLLALSEQEGVTHLVVDRRHLEGRPDPYFRPFDRFIKEARYANLPDGFEFYRQRGQAEVFTNEILSVLDLSKITSSPD